MVFDRIWMLLDDKGFIFLILLDIVVLCYIGKCQCIGKFGLFGVKFQILGVGGLVYVD